MNSHIKVAFDVDGTLIWNDDTPRWIGLDLLRWFYRLGNNKPDLIVWSGSGVEYAERWCEKLGIRHWVRVIEKGSEAVDIAIDDMPATEEGLNAKVVLQV